LATPEQKASAEEVVFVEKIIDKRRKRNNKVEYLVVWKVIKQRLLDQIPSFTGCDPMQLSMITVLAVLLVQQFQKSRLFLIHFVHVSLSQPPA